MGERAETPRFSLRTVWLLLLALALATLVSAGVFGFSTILNTSAALSRLDVLTTQMQDELATHVNRYAYGLRGARGAIVAVGSDDITAERFRRYAATRDLQTEFPGAKGFGFIRFVPDTALPAFLKRAAAERRDGFTLKTFSPTLLLNHFIIQYVEPLLPNKAATGFDIATDETRRLAALHAARTGEATITAPIELVQKVEGRKNGFLVFLPIYQPGFATVTTAQMSTGLIGWAYVPLAMDEVLARFDPSKGLIRFTLTDIQTGDSFFSTSKPKDENGWELTATRQIQIFGRTWRLDVRSLPSFWSSLNLIDRKLSTTVAFTSSISLLFFIYAGLLAWRRRRQIATDKLQLATIVESTNDCVIGTTLEGIVTSWNRAAEQTFGFTGEEAIGRSMLDLIVPADRGDEGYAMLFNVARGMPVENFYTQRQRRDGRILETAVTVSPVYADDGSIIGAAAFLRDISQQRATEARLNMELGRLAAIIENSDDAIIGRTIDGHITSWNATAVSLFGYTSEAALGRTLNELIVPIPLHAEERAAFQQVVDGERLKPFRTMRHHQDGTLVPMLVSILPIWSAEGELLGIATVARDVSAEVAAERRIHEANSSLGTQVAERTAALKASSALQSAILDHAGYALISTDPSGTITLFNPAAERMLGYSAAELVGRHTPEIFHEPQELEAHAKNLSAELRRPIRAGFAALTMRVERRIPDMRVCTLVTKDGTRLPVSLSLCRLESDDGLKLGYLGIAQDLTDQIKRESELNDAKLIAEDAARAKSQFLASISHELRTPLNSIIGFSALLLEHEPSPDVAHRQAQIIFDASKTLLSIVNDVLDVSKLEASQIELDPQPFCPRKLLESTASLLQDQARSKGLDFLLHLDASLPDCLIGDDARIRQILLNLISNAIKFTSEGHVRVATDVVGAADGVYRVRFVVADTGIGVPASSQHRLFKRFSQADSSTSRRFGGTGLGLAICKDLVELMNGSIEFESVEGEGSKFSFELLLREGSPVRLAAEPNLTSIGEPLNILLAEDLLVNQEFAVAMLKKMGHSVDVVCDGAAAVQAVQHGRYDLVLMDVQMPTMDGVEATYRIRSLGGDFLTLPIIAMTANVQLSDIETYRAAGMDGHLGKPFLPEKLRETIQDWSSRLRAMRGASVRPEANEALEAVEGDTSEILDPGVYEGFVDIVGDVNAGSLIAQFADDLRDRFSDPSDLETLRGDAHSIASTAGMIGFMLLSKAARELQNAAERRSVTTLQIEKVFEQRGRALEQVARL